MTATRNPSTDAASRAMSATAFGSNPPVDTRTLIDVPLDATDCIDHAGESDRFTITAQPDRSGEEHRGDRQPDPETWCAQISARSQFRQRFDRVPAVRPEGERLRSPAKQAVVHHGGEIRSVERNLLEDLDRN